MWATSPILARPSPPCVLRLGIRARISNLAAISSKLQRRPPPHNDGRDRNSNSVGHTVLVALRSDLQNKPLKTSNPKQQQRKSRGEEEEERQISGSDVLLALQRANAQKIKKKTRNYSSSSSSTSKPGRSRGRSGTDREDEEDDSDYSDVRSICLKSDWITRLDELEKRLHELIVTTT